MSESSEKARTVPFGAWTTFKTFVDADLKSKVVPAKIDKSMLVKKSGSAARQLVAALRFFALVDGDSDNTNEKLRALVAAYGTENWKAAVSDLLTSYEPILRGVDVSSATQGELEVAFKTRGNVTGDTLTKAVRLYLTMAAEAGVKLSPFFTSVRAASEDSSAPTAPAASATPSNGNKPKKKKTAARERPNGENGITDKMTPTGVDAIQPLPGSEFRVWIPKGMPKAELEFAMKYLRDYLKLTRGTD